MSRLQVFGFVCVFLLRNFSFGSMLVFIRFAFFSMFGLDLMESGSILRL
jgi:hypothetical protein